MYRSDMQTITGIFLLAVFFLIVFYDLYVYLKYGQDGTISSVFRHLNQQCPLWASIVAFAMGVLWGHFFW